MKPIAAAFAAIAIIVAVLMLPDDGPPGPPPLPRPESIPRPRGETLSERYDRWAAEGRHVSAEELFRAYEDNEVAADARFKGETVLVNGPIRRIGKDILDRPYLMLGSEVQAMFSTSDETMLAALRRGQTVEVECICSGKLGDVILRDCSLRDRYYGAVMPGQR